MCSIQSCDALHGFRETDILSLQGLRVAVLISEVETHAGLYTHEFIE